MAKMRRPKHCLHPPDATNPPGERERAEALSHKNRFLAILACVAKRREQKLEGVAGGAESAGFCGFALRAKLPRLKLKI